MVFSDIWWAALNGAHNVWVKPPRTPKNSKQMPKHCFKKNIYPQQQYISNPKCYTNNKDKQIWKANIYGPKFLYKLSFKVSDYYIFP